MVRAGRQKRAPINYAGDDNSDSEDEGRANGSKRAHSESDESIEEVVTKRPKAAAGKRKSAAPAPSVVYKDTSSEDDMADDGELEGEGSDFEPEKPAKKKVSHKKKTPAKKSHKKKTPVKKSPQKKSAGTPSRASGRAAKSIVYADDSGQDEESEPEESSEDEAPARKKAAQKGGRKGGSAAAKRGKGRKSYAEDSDDESEEEEEYVGKRGKKGGRGVVRPKLTHPPVSEMVPTAIRRLAENPRRGSSLAAIKGYIAEEWGVDIKALAAKIRNYVINAVSDGELKQTKGKGASGRFTLPGMKAKKRKRKLKELTEEELTEVDYKPVKRARDEEREREEEDKERRRQQRREEEYKKELEKEARPVKKQVKRQTEYEVEFIKAMRVVDDKTYYQVKFEGWKKLYWEPEEHLDTCQDLIDNFIIEEKVRKKEAEEKRRREEEEGKYEVRRILEVKFPKDKPREFLIRWKGHGEDMDSWEPETNLDCEDLIERFMLTHEKRLEASEKRLREAPKVVQRMNYSQSHRVSKRTGGFRVTYADMDE